MKSEVKKTVKNANSKTIAVFFVFLILLIYFSCTFISQQIKMNESNRQLASLNKKIEQQEKRNKQLLDKKKKVNTPEYMEKIAREKLGFVAPDEIVFMDATQVDK